MTTPHQAATFSVDTRVRKCALELHDTILLAKLSAGDLISQEAVYHSSCLVSLHNKAIRNRTESSGDKTDKMFQGDALAELLSYIEETRTESTYSIPIFKFADLAKLYTSHLKQLGVNILGRIHTTDLKNQIWSKFPDMQNHRQGRDILLAFDEDIGLALQRVFESDLDEEAISLSKAAKIVRRDLLIPSTLSMGLSKNNAKRNPSLSLFCHQLT